MSTMVVGVDGSSGSLKALRFALEEARLHESELKVVAAWFIPPAVYGAGWAPAPIDVDGFRKVAEDSLEKCLSDVDAAGSGVKVVPLVREGQPADVLCDEARDADLLVVGSRGRGGFRGLLLGSVSQQCAHHALCPVVIVPKDESEADEENAR